MSPDAQKSQRHHVSSPSSPSATATPQDQRHRLASRNSAPVENSTSSSATHELQSHSMTSTNSAEPEVADPASTGTSGTPAPYGTRSRGRNAAPRPNYAEDRDTDMDFEISSYPASKSAKRAAGSASHQPVNGLRTDGEKAPNSHSRKNPPTANGSHASSPGKDAIPGTSSFSAKPDDNSTAHSASRKRKQPPNSANSNANNGHASKKVFTTAPDTVQNKGYSNMVTFETHGAYLKNGKLKADDGSTYAVNGEDSLGRLI